MLTKTKGFVMQHEDLAVSILNKTTAGGAATSVVGTVSQVDILTIVGVVVAIAGFLVSLFFQLRRDRRENKEHEARMEEIQRGKRD